MERYSDVSRAQEQRLARADLCRFVAACYYEPGPEFEEERLFDSLLAAADRVDPDVANRARRLGDAYSAEGTDRLLVDYARLFIGPARSFTRPYASAWSTGVQGAPAYYEEGGFEIDEGFRELPDHIAVELEFLYRLIHQDASRELRARFLRQHLLTWVPAFADAVQEGAETAFYRELARITGRIVDLEAGRMK